MHFETAEYPDESLGKVNPSGFVSPPGGKNGSSFHMLNDHSYCCQLSPEICASGQPDPTKEKECKEWHDKRIFLRAKDAKELQVPFILTEFGACFDSDVCATEITQVADAADEIGAVGWAYWQFKLFKDLTTTAGTGSEGFYNNDGSLQHKKLKALTRPYFPLVQGKLLSQAFNFTTG